MKILLISSAYNGLTQRAHLELMARSHEVHVELAISDGQLTEAVARLRPDIVICPFLKTKLPQAIWLGTRSIIIHPGIVGDRGPSSLDWAIQDGETSWGVTAFEANDEFDAGDVWASATFAMRMAPKASLYRQEVTEAAIGCILKAIERVLAGERPTPLRMMKEIRGRQRPLMRRADRAIDWRHDSTLDVLRKIHAADSAPGVLSELCGLEVFLYGACEEGRYRGEAGAVIARRDGAVCVGATDGAVWISHLRQRGTKQQRHLKLPATRVLGDRLHGCEEAHCPSIESEPPRSYHEIRYDECGDVGYVHFDFHNGAMSTEQCQHLRRAFHWAKARPTKIIALVGGEDFHGNGIHLSAIDAAADPAAESWRNINAINDLIHDVLTCTSHLTVSGVQGNAGAGGAVFAVACDLVAARSGRVFNFHYKTMGLHGSEYWTYLLPKRIGAAAARSLTESCLPTSAEKAAEMGLVDVLIDARGSGFMGQLASYLGGLSSPVKLGRLLQAKREALPSAEVLEQYRRAELARMRIDFDGPAYAAARKAFVRKEVPGKTPSHLTLRRDPERPIARPSRLDGVFESCRRLQLSLPGVPSHA